VPISYLCRESASTVGSATVGLKSEDMGTLFLMFRSYLRRQKKSPISAATPMIGRATIRAILTFPRRPVKKPLVETVSVRPLELISVELFEGFGGFGEEVGRLLEEGPLVVDDEPALPGVDEPDPEVDPELDDSVTLVNLLAERDGVNPEELVTP